MIDAKLDDEQGRLAALRRYEVLDTPREAPFERITGLVQAVLNVPISTVSLIDSDRQWYKSCVGMENTDLPRELSFCTHAIRSREPLLIPDTFADPRFSNYPSVTGEPFIRSYLGIPLSSPDGYNLGSLCALDKKPRDFNAGEIAVLKNFAALVIDELELRRIAQVDYLTEAVTRRSFLLEVEKSISRFRRYQTPASLLAMDIDHFKHVNDSFGHPVGDSVLRDVSRELTSQLRTEDVIGRLGGEEFGILLFGTSMDKAVEAAERLRQTVEGMHFSAETSFRVTASFGIASLGNHETTVEEWMGQADAALYDAKRSGRNKCCAAQQLLAV